MPTVIIYWSPGRTEAQKTAVATRITAALVGEGGARQSDVLIIFQNILTGDSVRGSQVILTDQTDQEESVFPDTEQPDAALHADNRVAATNTMPEFNE